MKVEYKRDLKNNYMIIEIPDAGDGVSYETLMAEKNKIPGLLPFHSVRKDGSWFLYYDITSRQPLGGMYEKKRMNGKEMMMILQSISHAIDTMEQYLLSPEHFVFQPDYIYLSPDKSQILLCYLPGTHESYIDALAEYILKHLDHEDGMAISLGYRFYQSTVEENFSLQKTLLEFLQEEKEYKSHEKIEKKEAESAFDYLSSGKRESTGNNPHSAEWRAAYQEQEEYIDHLERKGESISKKNRKNEQKKTLAGWIFERFHPAVVFSFLVSILLLEIAFYYDLIQVTEAGGLFFLLVSVEVLGNRFWKRKMVADKNQYYDEADDDLFLSIKEELYETEEEMEAIEETRFLAAEQETDLCLVCRTPDENGTLFPDIIPYNTRWEIGKMKGEVDYVLSSPTVSRRHARIERVDDTCYIIDQNSMNGTFVNGRKLKPQEKWILSDGDIVAFAQIEYQVRIQQ